MGKRIVDSGKYTQVVCLDEVGAGNACHEYLVIVHNKTVPTVSELEAILDSDKKSIETMPDGSIVVPLGKISFQNGPIQENGTNGIQNEDLIAICIDRLQGFQSGKFACRENANALTKLEEAMMWLRKRTADREARGVEGKTII